ncbi:MAG: helix-turn-helix domain-containing protein [Candidatus Nitrotoga sp.]
MKSTLVATQAAAEYLGGVKPNTLEIWRVQGIGPAYKKIGRLVRYSIEDLDKYIAAQSRSSTSQQVAA